MLTSGSRASSPDTSSTSPSTSPSSSPPTALSVGARIFVSRLAAGPEQLDEQRLSALVERALPWIEAEDVPLEVGLALLERVVLALLDDEPVTPRRHLRLVPRG